MTCLHVIFFFFFFLFIIYEILKKTTLENKAISSPICEAHISCLMSVFFFFSLNLNSWRNGGNHEMLIIILYFFINIIIDKLLLQCESNLAL